MGATRRIGKKHDALCLCPQPFQTIDDAGINGNAVMDHPLEIEDETIIVPGQL